MKKPSAYLVYWTLCCILFGVVIAPIFYEAKPPEMQNIGFTHNHKMKHGQLEINPDAPIPELSIDVTKDPMHGWNLTLLPKNFTFTPEKVGQKPVANEGHAHIYINGQKFARVYGTHYHLPELPPGEYDISVTLNANNHSTYAHNGKPISASQRIKETLMPQMEMDMQ